MTDNLERIGRRPPIGTCHHGALTKVRYSLINRTVSCASVSRKRRSHCHLVKDTAVLYVLTYHVGRDSFISSSA